MSDKDNGTNGAESNVTISRRRALAGLGTIGAAAVIGGGATYAQFTDTEEAAMTFSAGGIDGSLSYGATYNSSGDTLDEDEVVAMNEEQQSGDPVVSLSLPDVKPGDYGSITFGIEVTSNPAWVASCIGIAEDIDHETYEPEVEPDPHVNDVSPQSPLTAAGEGELGENLMLIPFYTEANPDSGDHPLEATFWDGGWPNYDYDPDSDFGGPLNSSALSPSSLATNAAFWNAREGGNNFGTIRPMTANEAAGHAPEPAVVGWGDGVPQPLDVPDPVASGIGDGCVFVDGDVTDPDNEVGDEPGAVDPGDTVYFGYDWHLPFGVGNEVQGDKLVLDFGFTFSQIRHTEAAALGNIFEPGANAPTTTQD